ncbi:MAG: hypothetical protein AB7R69_05585 [Candidatus Babeliales bacterium]
MKFLKYALCIVNIAYAAQEHAALSLYKETDHFKIYCTDVDCAVADNILDEAEVFFEQLTSDFNHKFEGSKILFNIYPDLVSFHKAIAWDAAPDWVVAFHDKNSTTMCSPLNPGPHHSYASLMKSSKNGLVQFFIHDTFKGQTIPRWLYQGVTLYKTNYYSDQSINELFYEDGSLPLFEQLENVEDTLAFDKLNGFSASFWMVRFLNERWGWNTILGLLENYSNFEAILGITKKEFGEHWIEFIKNKKEK